MHYLFRFMVIGAGLLIPSFGQPTSAADAQRAEVELEVFLAPIVSPEQGHAWLERLRPFGWDSLRIESQRDLGTPMVEDVSTPLARRYRVRAAVDGRDRLRVPGASFSSGKLGGLREWLERLRVDGPDGVIGKRGEFGLTESQLRDLHRQVDAAYGESTLDKRFVDILKAAQQGIEAAIVVDPRLEQDLRDREIVVTRELQGFSKGTVLAYVAGSQGWGIAPRRHEGETLLVLTPSDETSEVWPLGTLAQPPQSERIPRLYDKIPARIRNVSLATALRVLETRVMVPFLVDQWALNQIGVDLEKTPAEIDVRRETPYALILRKLLLDHQLKYEIRHDPARGHFIWITGHSR